MELYYTGNGLSGLNGRINIKAQTSKNSLQRRNLIRFFTIMLSITIIITFGAVFQTYANDNASSYNSANQIVVQVGQGDTLWTIAKPYLPANTDIRDYIAEIKKLNGLRNSSLQEGQSLLLPQ